MTSYILKFKLDLLISISEACETQALGRNRYSRVANINVSSSQEFMKTKYTLLIIITVITSTIISYFTISATFFQKTKSDSQAPAVKSVSTKADIFFVSEEVDFGELKPKTTLSIKAQTGETVLDILQKSTQLETKQTSFGEMVEAIDGIKNGTDGKYWIYYVNNQPATVGAGDFKAEADQKISWRLEKAQ